MKGSMIRVVQGESRRRFGFNSLRFLLHFMLRAEDCNWDLDFVRCPQCLIFPQVIINFSSYMDVNHRCRATFAAYSFKLLSTFSSSRHGCKPVVPDNIIILCSYTLSSQYLKHWGPAYPQYIPDIQHYSNFNYHY